MKLNLTACIICKNEEPHIERCLNSLSSFVENIILVDTGSKDTTLKIANKYNVNVFFHNWENDFSIARNSSIKYALNDWILILDADETIDLSNLNLPNLNSKIGGVRLNIKNYIDEELNNYSTHQYTRIFRRHPKIQFEGNIHEQINQSILDLGLEIIDSNIEIIHYGYINTSNDKKNRNKSLLEKSNLNEHYNKLNYADTLFSLEDNDIALKYYLEIDNSNELTLYQKEHVKIRIAQIYLKQNNFTLVKKYLEFKSSNHDLEGLRIFILAASYLSEKNYLESLNLYNKVKNSNTKLVNIKLVDDAINLLNKIIS